METFLPAKASAEAIETVIDGATSGHYQHTALALIADALRSRPLPGGGYLLTYVDSDCVATTTPVYGFQPDAAHGTVALTMDADGHLWTWPSDSSGIFRVWHPADVIGGQPLTHGIVLDILRKEDGAVIHS